MQIKNDKKKKLILGALASVIRELRGGKSQFMLAGENDISISIISTAERGLKDPQLTTIFKLAEAFNMTVVEFMTLIYKKMPKDFYLIEK